MDNDTLTQDAAIKLVESIGETLHLTRHDDKMGVSYYGISDNTVVRLSDHSTYLQTWIDYNSYSADNKYSIVIEVNPSKPNPIVNQDISFFVTEFKHKLKRLDDESVLALANAIKGALGLGCQFSNPFHVSPKLIMSKYKPVSGETNESKIYKNMKKNVKRINESQLRAIIAESVKKY